MLRACFSLPKPKNDTKLAFSPSTFGNLSKYQIQRTEQQNLISARVTVVKQFPGFNLKISYSCG